MVLLFGIQLITRQKNLPLLKVMGSASDLKAASISIASLRDALASLKRS